MYTTPMKKINAAFFCNDVKNINKVFTSNQINEIKKQTSLYPVVINEKNLSEHTEAILELDVMFSTWGMPLLTDEQLEKMPNLKAVFYAAGSVKGFAEPLLKKNILVVSAYAANAIPVAQFTLAQIILSCKGYFRNSEICRSFTGRTGTPQTGPGILNEKVALIGAGMIARNLINLLHQFQLDVFVVDPYLSAAEAEKMNVKIVSMKTAFKEALVVSNHLPNLPSLNKVLDYEFFSLMRRGATFINTGRGAQVNEDDLINVLKNREDLTALLDVTYPEPPLANSEFYTLPNVHLSSHIAGSLDNELSRMAAYVIDDFNAWKNEKPLKYQIKMEMLSRMA